MPIEFTRFQEIYEDIQSFGNVIIRFTQEKNNQTIRKEIKLSRVQPDKFYIQHVEYNDTTNTQKTILEKQLLTAKSFHKEHAYVATLFSALQDRPNPPRTIWEDFKSTDSKLKWLVRFFILDTRFIGGLVGRIIAHSANKGNKYYKTTPSSVLAKTLSPLIFPAGSKKPRVDPRTCIITIDSILYKQYKALQRYNPDYQSENGKIRFTPKSVRMPLRNDTIELETITASNQLVNETNQQNHLTILYFNGNSGCFQQDYQRVAEDLLSYQKMGIPASAVQFNYPGILNSEGCVEVAPELIHAGIAQVNSLLLQGIPHSRIVLHGVSLGGSIASHVAAYFHALPCEDNPSQRQTLGGLYADRTFASTAQVGRDFFNRALGDNALSRFISTLCLPCIKLGTWASNWDLDTGKAFFSLPRERRNYSVVLSPKTHREAYRDEHKGSALQQLATFMLRRRVNPVDDGVLRRGLHDSWEKCFEGLLMKSGYYGKTAKENYSTDNRYRKMMVVDLRKNQFAPEIDGHGKAHYCYTKKSHSRSFFNPNKPDKDKLMGLVHRSDPVQITDQTGQARWVLPVHGHEAGEVARRSIISMGLESRKAPVLI